MSADRPQGLDTRVKAVWRIGGSLTATLIAGAPALACAMIARSGFAPGPLGVAALCLGTAWALWLAASLTFLPALRLARWHYRLDGDYLRLEHGIVWQTVRTIPFIRVQDTSTSRGPLDRAFGLASVTVSTAAEGHKIPGLSLETAEQLRDRAAELARLAREDV